MLHRISLEEESDDTNSTTSSVPSSDLEKLDLSSPGTAMSSVYSADTQSSASSGNLLRRSSSPSRHGSFHRRSSSRSSADTRRKKDEDRLGTWLQRGNVIYKSVGLGLMDLSVGLHLIGYAKQKGVGSHIEGF